MGMSPKVGIRAAANFIIISITLIVVLAGMLIAANMLGAFLLPLVLVGLFLLAVYFTGGFGMTGWQIIIGIIIMFAFGYGAHAFLGSTIGYDPLETGYATGLSAIKLSTSEFGLTDATFSAVLGFIVIIIVVVFAMVGLAMQARKGRR